MGHVPGKDNVTMAFANKVSRRTQRSVEVVEADLIKVLLIVHTDHIVAEGHERHMDGTDSLQQIRINGPSQYHSVNQSVLLKNARQIDSLGRRLRQVVQRREQHVLLHPARIRFHALQNARVKRMKEIAVAQQKTYHLRSAFQDPARLGIGTKSQTMYGVQHPCASFP